MRDNKMEYGMKYLSFRTCNVCSIHPAISNHALYRVTVDSMVFVIIMV